MTTTAEHTYAELRRRLADGRHGPGEHLREEDLAARLGVSRTPIREAIRRLAAEGWVRIVPNLGAFVAEWRPEDIEEIFALRALLEPHAAAHAAANARPEDIARLQEICRRGEQAVGDGTRPDLQEVSDANLDLHKTILRISGQVRTEAMVSNLYAMPIILKNFGRYDEGHLRRSMLQHRELVEAIGAGDPAWASAVMRSHVEAGKALYRVTSPRSPRAAADNGGETENGHLRKVT